MMAMGMERFSLSSVISPFSTPMIPASVHRLDEQKRERYNDCPNSLPVSNCPRIVD